MEISTALTQEVKEKCAEIFKVFAGIDTPVHRWNEATGNLLAEMVNHIKDCSHGMGLARSVWPSASKVTLLWLVKLPYHIIRNEFKMKLGYVNNACLSAGIIQYKDAIKWELIK